MKTRDIKLALVFFAFLFLGLLVVLFVIAQSNGLNTAFQPETPAPTVTATATATPTPTFTSTITPTPVPTLTETPKATETRAPTAAPAATATPIPAASPAAPSVRVLCDGKVYDGYASRLFQLDSAEDQDPTIQKVIRNCTFRNSSIPAIVINSAKNVLIEGNTFENIRTNIPGDGVHAINITGPRGDGVVDNVTIRNNTFKWIGADGIQLGQNSRAITNILIQNNEFVAREGVGENAVDVKGAEGPIAIVGNTMHGFRPCLAPKSNPSGTQDCTGSNGPAITIHDGGLIGTAASNVTIQDNELYDNTFGLSITAGAKNVTVRGNRIHDNLSAGIVVDGVESISITGNTFSNNPVQIKLTSSPLTGGACAIRQNTFAGDGKQVVQKNSICD